MGANDDFSRTGCQSCHRDEPSVTERGRAYPLARLCDTCWNVLAGDLAEAEGATASPMPGPGPDDCTWFEPPTCRECGAHVMNYPTNYDRWVCLATTDVPAAEVAPRYRWRLKSVPGAHSSYGVALVAVKVRSFEPLPGELVRPAHRALCSSPDAVRDNIYWSGGSWSA